VEGYRPGVLEKLLHQPNVSDYFKHHFPSLIVCRITGYGQTGPLAMKPGHDIDYVATAGVLGMQKLPQDTKFVRDALVEGSEASTIKVDPLPVQVADIAGGSYPAALQIVAALYRRDHDASRRGSIIDVSMTDGAHALLGLPLAQHYVSGMTVGGGNATLNGAIPGYGLYQGKTRHTPSRHGMCTSELFIIL
jgi:alpha-methylacyl-CoA racemase